MSYDPPTGRFDKVYEEGLRAMDDSVFLVTDENGIDLKYIFSQEFNFDEILKDIKSYSDYFNFMNVSSPNENLKQATLKLDQVALYLETYKLDHKDKVRVEKSKDDGVSFPCPLCGKLVKLVEDEWVCSNENCKSRGWDR